VPAYVSRLGLSQTEIYVWNLLQTPRTFSWLLENSWLGPAETRKTVLILTCLRLLDFNRQESGYNEVSQPEGLDLEKAWPCLMRKPTSSSAILPSSLARLLLIFSKIIPGDTGQP